MKTKSKTEKPKQSKYEPLDWKSATSLMKDLFALNGDGIHITKIELTHHACDGWVVDAQVYDTAIDRLDKFIAAAKKHSVSVSTSDQGTSRFSGAKPFGIK